MSSRGPNCPDTQTAAIRCVEQPQSARQASPLRPNRSGQSAFLLSLTNQSTKASTFWISNPCKVLPIRKAERCRNSLSLIFMPLRLSLWTRTFRPTSAGTTTRQPLSANLRANWPAGSDSCRQPCNIFRGLIGVGYRDDVCNRLSPCRLQ